MVVSVLICDFHHVSVFTMALSKQAASLTYPEISEKPHQPHGFDFPKREYGKQMLVKRSCQSTWFSQWTWLHYRTDDDSVFCHTCVKACKELKMAPRNADDAFIKRGYNNWKLATTAFRQHETSGCHKEAVEKLFTLPATTRDIGEALSAAHAEEKLENCKCLLKILSNLRFLARQSCAIRGDGDEGDSNFIQLFKLRGEDDPKVFEWMMKRSNKYTSHEMQNEMLKVMALKVLRDVASRIRTSSCYSIMADETTDVSNQEQLTIVLRWVDSDFSVHEEFVGLHAVPSISSDTLVSVIKDILIRFNLPLSKARGQCYDGASNMSGIRSGVAAQITREESRAVYTHCYGHSLNLACNDSFKHSKVMKDALNTTHEITKLVKYSPRREAVFEMLKKQLEPDSPGIRILCPTRWTVRADSLASILSNYEVLRELWEECLEIVRDSETIARIVGVASQMQTFNFLFGVELGELILRHTDNLSRTLQHKELSASESQEVARLTVRTLGTMRNESSFDLFWKKLEMDRTRFEVDEPVLPRKRKCPERFEVGTAGGVHPASPKIHFLQQYYEALDLIINCIKSRFDQPGYNTYKHLQELLFKAIKGDEFETELQHVSQFYGDDINKITLKSQLQVLHVDFPDKTVPLNIFDIKDYMKSLSPAKKLLLSEVCTVLRLVLVMPATNATSERSFSALRRVKSYLRSTMRQDRLNHLMILHVHKELTDALDLKEVGNDFVCGSEHRLRLFGKFS